MERLISGSVESIGTAQFTSDEGDKDAQTDTEIGDRIKKQPSPDVLIPSPRFTSEPSIKKPSMRKTRPPLADKEMGGGVFKSEDIAEMRDWRLVGVKPKGRIEG